MTAPTTSDLLAALHDTTTRDDATRLAEQLRRAASWAALILTPLAALAVIVAVVWVEVRG